MDARAAALALEECTRNRNLTLSGAFEASQRTARPPGTALAYLDGRIALKHLTH